MWDGVVFGGCGAADEVGFRTQSGMDDAEGKRWGWISVMLIWIFEEQGTNDCERVCR